jgi:hypothetical protein
VFRVRAHPQTALPAVHSTRMRGPSGLGSPAASANQVSEPLLSADPLSLLSEHRTTSVPSLHLTSLPVCCHVRVVATCVGPPPSGEHSVTRAHAGGALCLKTVEYGVHLVSGGRDHCVRVWDRRNMSKPLQSTTTASAVFGLAICPTDSWILAG